MGCDFFFKFENKKEGRTEKRTETLYFIHHKYKYLWMNRVEQLFIILCFRQQARGV